jgi:prophage regulatory protein
MTTRTYMTDKQVAERVGVARETIWRWLNNYGFPRPYKPGPNMTRWRLSDIEEWEGSLKRGFMVALPPGLGEPFGALS